MSQALTAIENWMVESNLKTIKKEGGKGKEIIATLKRNGYLRVAASVERRLKQVTA